jgi:hypothetical protein
MSKSLPERPKRAAPAAYLPVKKALLRTHNAS